MKNQESFVPQIEIEGSLLTEEMKRNNPNAFWESFLKQSGKSIFNVLLGNIDPNGEGLNETISSEYKNLKKEYQQIISKDELLRYSLEYYRDHEDPTKKPYVGFGKASGLEQKYEELCAKVEENRTAERKERIENRIKNMVEAFADKKNEADDVNSLVEDAVKKLIKEESPTSEEVTDFRARLWSEIYK